MSKLTKAAANKTAQIMANNAMDVKIQEIRDLRSEIIEKGVIKMIPPVILEFFKNNPELECYISTESSFRFKCEELHECYDYVSVSESYPSNKSSSRYVNLSNEDYEKCMSLTNEIDTINNKKYKLTSKIEATLLAIGTLKRIEKEFPEAYSVIPSNFITPRIVETIALPIEDLKAELLKYK